MNKFLLRFFQQASSFVSTVAPMAVTLFLVTSLFTSCLEDSTEIAPQQEFESPQSIIQLATPEKWVNVEGEAEEKFANDLSKKRANNSGGNDRGRFNISLKFIVPTTDEQIAVFEDAAGRWERIIIGDVPSFTGTLPSAFNGFPPAVDGTVDDILIEVALAPIDGPGGILGQAGPRFIRTSDNLTLTGVMFFDVDDLAFLDQLGLFEDVIVHEMGHVLGIGTLWDFERDLIAGTAEEPYFTGRKANVFWNAEGGTNELPIENTGGPGTRFGHWRESVLGNELMTGFLNLGENPLSRITAGSIRDLGYRSSSVGESYDLPRGSMGVDPDDISTEGEGLNIGAMEEVLLPIGSVSTN